MSRIPTRQTIFAAKAAAGTGNPVEVKSFKNVGLDFRTASGADLTVKIQASFSETAPDFSSAPSDTNSWFYCGVWDLDSVAAVAGSTGFGIGGVDVVYGLLLNVDNVNWVCATITAYAAGNLSLDTISVTNQ